MINIISVSNKNSEWLLIINANIIDVKNKIIHENSYIISLNGKIYQIGSMKQLTIPKKMEILDVRSMYIIPGLIDSHVHLAHPGVDDYGRIFTESITKKYIRHSH